MKALVISKPSSARVEEVPYPEPGQGEITVKVERAGICGTDSHIFDGEYAACYPVIPGHEFSGVVDQIGREVEDWETGDRVIVDPSLFCGQCRFCLTGRTNHCETFGAIGVTVDGALAEYVAVPVQTVYRLPDSLSFAEGAFVEPLACVAYGMRRLKLSSGARVLIFGAGTMGLLFIQAMAREEISELVAVDLSPAKLALAKTLGATRAVLGERVERELGSQHYPHGFDVVVDTTGEPGVIQNALDFLGPAASYLQFGVAPKNAFIQVNPFDLYHKDWTLLGSMAINQTFLPALNWLKAGQVEVQPLIGETVKLEQIADYFTRPKDPHALKTQVLF